jgi:hypothetical protein
LARAKGVAPSYVNMSGDTTNWPSGDTRIWPPSMS